MNKLIRYKGYNVNLNNVIEISPAEEIRPEEIGIIFHVLANTEIHNYTKSHTIWQFDTVDEQKKVFKYILDNYFIDIEKEINKEITKWHYKKEELMLLAWMKLIK